MNYRHAFHAGNFADVHKHVVLLALLHHLHKKSTPFFFLDTHAGRGTYDLRSDEALRSGEAQLGITRLLATSQIAALDSYINYIKSAQPEKKPTVRYYSGSPLLACSMLREQDRAVFIEKNPIEAAALKHALGSQKRVSVLTEDGYAALKAQLPPKENRGLVLIDPPYESNTEFNDAAQALLFAVDRWPNGIFCLWYPIKPDSALAHLQSLLLHAGIKKIIQLELSIRPSDSPLGLNGSGLLILNPPWQLDTQMSELLPQLHRALAPEGTGGTLVHWLTTE